jgi:SAM-dependent methyltransferase
LAESTFSQHVGAIFVWRITRRFELPLWGYVWGKLWADPIFATGFALLQGAPLPVLDIGCGLGLFEFYLRERGYQGPLRGHDFDARKIRRGQKVAARAYPDVCLSEGDVMAADPGAPGHVVIFDVLHYLDREGQARLLEHAASQVAPGAFCLIRDTPRSANWRFRVTLAQEAFARASRWLKTGAVHYPSVDEVTAPFRARGFQIEVRPLWGHTPFNSHLFILRAPA